MPATAKEAAYSKAEAQVLDLSQKAIAIRSVRGEGNRTIDVARLFGDALVAGGWSASDIEITPVDDTAYIIATWKGSNPALKPLVISGHMDVVEAKREDWERDPFVPVVEDGILYGRGASDMKFDGALALSTLIELRRQGFKPKRTIVIEFSGDEETTMKTSAIIAERLKNAELVINVDGGGGLLDEATAKPLFWTWQGAEKTYADYRLEVTNPGGHSSAPRPDNAIVQLSQALVKVGAYKFKAEQNEITKAAFEKAAPFTEKPEVAAAMRAFAANPADENALATLRADPAMVGLVGTTCVPTMLGGGHAENALPQRAFANINCRIFPGHSKEEIMAELGKVIDDPVVKITDVTVGSVASSASPLRPDLMAAVTKAMAKAYPGVPLVPSQSSGASDSMWFRAVGVPSYGLSPTFSKDSESFAHGLNERTRLSNIRPGITYYLSLITDLTK
ncbi:M20/M25/M40 family metallo-hydrolase [Novosphingobium sp. ERW19]|uniref:M20/M25/M40 family metallo-hydrolase n=1 Tax=Novosphingobium sp. ERW19 TaxID=2726186 RepID=UPI001F104DF5|nr:M20/M25/M40 family metallo-hydrolase [Novosphingobium sp. ERW19]